MKKIRFRNVGVFNEKGFGSKLALPLGKGGDRAGEGSEYRNGLCRVTTHTETRLLCFMWLSLFLKVV